MAFFGRPGHDRDDFDTTSRHLLIEDRGRLAGCCRVMLCPTGAAAGGSYSATFYDLAPLSAFSGPVLELGRFCTDRAWPNPDIPRLIWAEITRLVDANGIELLFGCTSLAGTDPAVYAPALAHLHAYCAPGHWRPRARANAFRFPPPGPDAGTRTALRTMPPLLRSYLGLGGRVSDHGVIDRAMGTLHVFTGVEIAAIPAARKRLLRADAMA